ATVGATVGIVAEVFLGSRFVIVVYTKARKGKLDIYTR
ncbi:MAG: hypothetical protein ACJATV_000214, partial [Granulosicoccus sp.]